MNSTRLSEFAIESESNLCLGHVSDARGSQALAPKVLELSPSALPHPMHHYDIYRDQLSITHPSFGHALLDPAPESVFGPVKVGDVGYVREGRFIRLFNALLPADDPSHKEIPLPEYHEPLTPNNPDHIVRETLKPNRLCSAGVNIVTVGSESRTSG